MMIAGTVRTDWDVTWGNGAYGNLISPRSHPELGGHTHCTHTSDCVRDDDRVQVNQLAAAVFPAVGALVGAAAGISKARW
jgi:hypothetical protein